MTALCQKFEMKIQVFDQPKIAKQKSIGFETFLATCVGSKN